MRQLNKPIDTILSFAQVLTSVESNSIKGGDLVSDLLTNIFHRQVNVTNEQWNIFVANITDLASTSIGHDVLNQLLIANKEIKITGDIPSNNASAEYAWTSTNKKIAIGNYDVSMGSLWSFDKTSHEIYHAFEDIVENTLNSIAHDVKAEIDAQLFARMAEVQFDTNHNIEYGGINSHVFAGLDFANSNNPLTIPQLAFNYAWSEILKNHNFTLATYNVLVNNFIDGSIYSSGSTGITSANTVTNLNNTKIDDFFLSYFGSYTLTNTYTDTGNNGTGSGSGSGGTGGGTSGNTGSGFFTWYNALQNSGYQFYTSYNTTNNPGFSDMGIYAWIPGSTTTNYNEPTLGQWFNAWASGWSFGGGGNGSSWGFFPSHS